MAGSLGMPVNHVFFCSVMLGERTLAAGVMKGRRKRSRRYFFAHTFSPTAVLQQQLRATARACGMRLNAQASRAGRRQALFFQRKFNGATAARVLLPLSHHTPGLGRRLLSSWPGVPATASWTATGKTPHQRFAQPEDAAARTAGDGRRAQSRTTRSRTKHCAAGFQRPISEPRTTNFCGPPLASSGYVQCLHRSATFSAAPSTSTVHGCESPVLVILVQGDTSVASQHRAPPLAVAP